MVNIPDVSNGDTKFIYLKFPSDSKSPCGLGQILINETYMSLYAALWRRIHTVREVFRPGLAQKPWLWPDLRRVYITFYCYHRST